MGLVIGEGFLFRHHLLTNTHHILQEGEDCAKNKDQPRSSKAIQKDRDRKDQSEKGVCTAYPDEEVGQQKESFEKAQIGGKRECKRDQDVNPLHLNATLKLMYS